MTYPFTRISDFCRVKHGYAFKSRYFESEGPYVLLTPGNFNEEGGYRDQGDKTKYYTGDVPDGFVLEEGDLLVAMTEQAPGLLGSSAWIPESNRFLHNQRLGRIVDLDEGRVDKKFLYYLFNTREVRHQISASATGTKVRHTAPERIGRVLVPLPPRKVQGWIASALSAYDDLIENNRRRMALLEEAARQLYREWFVRLRFPGHEHTRVMNGVPEGWERKTIAEICDTVGGGTPSTKVDNYWDGDITWVVPSDVTKNDCLVLLESERKITESGLRESSAKIVPPWTILMTSRASVGFFALMDHEVCTNQGFINIIPQDDVLRMYLLFNLIHRVEEIRANAKGTTYPEIIKGRFRHMDVIVPPRSLLQEFDTFANDCIKQVRCAKQQNKQLRAARDLLLPRLMSGEIAV